MRKKGKYEIGYVKFFDLGMDILWYGPIGFGHVTVYYTPSSHYEDDEDGDIDEIEDPHYVVDSEHLGEEFVEMILKLAQKYIIEHMEVTS